MEGSPKDDKKDTPRDERKDRPRDERPPREEEYRDADRYRRDDRRQDWGRDDYRRPEPRGQPMDMGAFFMPQRIGMMALLGVILLLIGAMLATSAIITDTTWNNNDDKDDDIEESREGYKNGLYISEIGLLLIALPLFGGALLNDQIDEKMRIGMLIGGSIVVFALFTAIANGIWHMGV